MGPHRYIVLQEEMLFQTDVMNSCLDRKLAVLTAEIRVVSHMALMVFLVP